MPRPVVPGAEPGFRLRSVAFSVFGPTVVSSTGYGAVAPILALRARELGADVSTAAFVVALASLGMLVLSLPAGAMVARIGERRALVLAGVLAAAAMLLAALSTSVVILAVAVGVMGMAWTVFLMARQGFVIDAVPLSHRARALSTLGGMGRVGLAVGPLAGAGVIHVLGLAAVFAMAATLFLTSSAMAWVMPDLGADHRAEQQQSGHLGVWSVLVAHRHTLLTLGAAVVVIGGSRSVRNGLLPLWAEHIGVGAATTSLVFAVAGAVDVLFFFPGGWLMDHRGRAVVAVPVVLTVAIGVLVLPLTSGAWGFAAVVLFIAVGNGLGSGVVMTLGADAAPRAGRAQFLGGWRLCGDIGTSGGPLLVGALAAVAPLATACLALGALALVGTGWVGYWTRREDLQRKQTDARESGGRLR